MKFEELAGVRLLVTVPGCKAKVGALGTVVATFASPDEAYEVEFVGINGRPIDVCTLLPTQLESISKP